LGGNSGLPFDGGGSGVLPKGHMKSLLAIGNDSLHENSNDNSVKSNKHSHINIFGFYTLFPH